MSYGDLEIQGARMSWRTIETAPLDQCLIVAVDQSVGEAHHCGSDGWYWAGNDPTDSWGGQIYPTHWMPLPEPPTPNPQPLTSGAKHE